ncbi:MAG: MFS transporter [Gemmatimonadetes bacterium]|nr:MAG: MFS transporter [Gemmatimonadota bacterium]
MVPVHHLLKVFESRKMAALLLLGFSSGLPLLLTNKTVQAWMTFEGVDLGTVGLFSLVGLPYSLKFIWAPLLDRYVPPFLGRRRGWLAITQVGLMIALATMALHDPTVALQMLALNTVIIAFLSASQDIAVDAYRTDVLEEREMGAGVSVWVLGYRVGMLIAGSLTFVMAKYMSWQMVYLAMSGLMLIGLTTSFWSPAPQTENQTPTSLFDSVIFPFIDFFRRLNVTRASLILLFIILYKLGDGILGNMATPFLIKTGFDEIDIGLMQGVVGLLATMIGVVAGGVILSRIGINRSMWVFGGLQAVSNLMYLILAIVGKNDVVAVLAISVENFCAGLVTSGFVAYLMSLCNPKFSATQFALLTSLMAVSRDILVAPAGKMAEATGWIWFFLISILLALPGLLLLPVAAPWNAPAEQVES